MGRHPEGADVSDRREAIAETLTYLAGAGLLPDGDQCGADRFHALTAKEATEVAAAVLALEADEACCPLCQEVTCDEGCPVQPLRSDAPSQ